jgi:hypothetical protein
MSAACFLCDECTGDQALWRNLLAVHFEGANSKVLLERSRKEAKEKPVTASSGVAAATQPPVASNEPSYYSLYTERVKCIPRRISFPASRAKLIDEYKVRSGKSNFRLVRCAVPFPVRPPPFHTLAAAL